MAEKIASDTATDLPPPDRPNRTGTSAGEHGPPDTRSWIKSIRPVPRTPVSEVALGVVAGLVVAGALYGLAVADGPAWAFALAGFALVAAPLTLYAYLWRRSWRAPARTDPASRSEVDLMRRAVDRLGSPWAVIGPGGKTVFVSAGFRAVFPGAPKSALRAVKEAVGDAESAALFDELCRAAEAGIAGRQTLHLRGGGDGEDKRRDQGIEAFPLDDRRGAFVIRACGAEPEVEPAAGGAPRLVLDETEAKVQQLMESAPVGAALLDFDGTVRRGNRVFREMIGADGRDVVGSRLAELVRKQDRDRLTEGLRKVISGDEPDMPIEISPRRNADAVLSIYMNKIDYGVGAGSNVIVYCIDTTEQKKLEVQFAQSQKMQAIGQLAGGVAHDFNNLLTAMIGFCDLLLLRHRPGEQSFADIMQIKQNANRAADLVRQLLAFSRQQTLNPSTLKITDVIADLTHLLRRLVGANIELRLKHGRDLGLIRVDKGQLEHVIINLVVNARDAMPEGGVVEIVTRNFSPKAPIEREPDVIPPGDYVLIEVRDEGTGIKPSDIGRIFEPFFSTKEVGSGTGLGLSTAYGIVKQTGGYIFVDSAVGGGSKFSILLPHHVPARAAEPAAVAADDGEDEAARDLTGAGTVMVVEDEDAVRLFSARALRNKGYTVIEATTGMAALETLEKEDGAVDLLVTDIVMPQMDGTTLINEVRGRWPDMKIICISGYAEDTFRQKLDQTDNIFFLPKPFSLSKLAGTIKDVMADTPQ